MDEKTGWLAFSLEIYNGGVVVNESAIMIQIISNTLFWDTYGVWVYAGAIVASVTSINAYYVWHTRSNPHKRTRASDVNKLSESTAGSSQGSRSLDVWLTRSAEDEQEKTYLSSTRIEKCWIFNSQKSAYLLEKVFHDDLLEKERVVALNNELRAFFKSEVVQNRIYLEAFFANIPSLLDSERLIISQLPSSTWLILLSSGRLSRTYLHAINLLCEYLQSLQNLENILLTDNFSPILDKYLNISRSFTYVEAPTVTQQIIENSKVLKEKTEIVISNDARGLTPSECEWILHAMEELSGTEEQERFFEEEVDVSPIAEKPE